MPQPPEATDRFIAELDAAVEAHMDWTRRIVRCAVLQKVPDDDVIDPLAHTLCRFGAWFTANREHFEMLDGDAARRIETAHRAMHDAIRAICTCVVAGQPGHEADLEQFERSQSELIGLLAAFKTLVLSAAVRKDPLTQLPLRYGIEDDYGLCQHEARRNGNQLYVVMIDVDNFKPINDLYGHQAGDQVLRHLAATLKATLRGSEPLYRYGGEEFLWLLKCRSAEEARQSARRVLATVGTTPVPVADDEVLRLTITLGLARAGEHETLSDAIARADRALYEGKRTGRNRFVFSES